ncbi:enoyl-CoA hydratase/isomerase family protein [Rhodobacteraceae bacterium 2CG4]|uniref:3-hydroxyisobutyryl-CoA hydrolase n=1 Tax=Halovulum marinum TaxID=2662447 RepID=A0A6L5Z1M1_9RHOB|nr:enoyl-CoA hydratase/isomerase family protein [Halovulum marinum]MSU89982.1 enoyl-CoA hydratase/isomerase family protein [Halovulum marinum]
MSGIRVRTEGRAGRLTLDRPQALNALTWDMVRAIGAALDRWADDPAVALVLIDAAGERAFCAGGDLAEMYRTARAGDYDYGRRFWADEYRMNARIAAYPKPVVALMQGFVMGGGVGIGCHAGHRVAGEDTRVAMPECAVGLVPDVGGSWLLARAPGRLGEYLGMTGTRMGPADAIACGFADRFVPRAAWPELAAALCAGGDVAAIGALAQPPGPAPLLAERARIDRLFGLDTAAAIAEAAAAEGWAGAAAALAGNSPLSVCCALALVRGARRVDTLPEALGLEYRFTARSAEHGDFVEGIRAAIIDKDRRPRWRHRALAEVSEADIAAMLAPVDGAPDFAV